MPAGGRKDPYKNCRFIVEVEGIAQTGFSEVTIPDSTQDIIEYREGNESSSVRKLPGLVKYGNITLKWGITDSLDLYNWRKLFEQGDMGTARRSMSIILLDEEGNQAARWNFYEAWPSKYDGPDLNAVGTDVAIETMEIVYERMERVQ